MNDGPPRGGRRHHEAAITHLSSLGLVEEDGITIRTDDFQRFQEVFNERRLDLSLSNQVVMTELIRALVRWPEIDVRLPERLFMHAQAAYYCESMGAYEEGISVGQVGLDLAAKHNLPGLERQLATTMGNLFMGAAYFDEACSLYVRVIELARQQGDSFLHAAALANIASLMYKMRCDRDVLDVVDRGLVSRPQWASGTPAFAMRNDHIMFSLANNGLGSAARLRDVDAGMRYLIVATPFYDIEPLSDTARAQFELNRVQFMLASNDLETADMLIENAVRRLCPTADANPRVRVLVALAQAYCDRASREADRMERSYRALADLLPTSQQVKTYHAAFLEELVALHQANGSIDIVGQRYVTNLLNHKSSVKYAELKRNIARRREIAATQTTASPAPVVGGYAYLAELLDGTGPRAATEDRRTKVMDGMRTAAYSTAESWAASAEFFQDPTAQHIFRVGKLAATLAAEIGLDPEHCVRIELAARLHDIGKTTVNEAILMKPRMLDAGEMRAAQEHSAAGAFMLQQSDDPILRLAAVICRSHHEWWNGTGYPDRLAGEAIPIEARIVALADVYDALANAQPYKGAWTHRAAVEQIMTESGTHHDPRLARAFLKVLERYVGQDRSHHEDDIETNDLLRSRRQLLSSIDSGGRFQ